MSEEELENDGNDFDSAEESSPPAPESIHAPHMVNMPAMTSMAAPMSMPSAVHQNMVGAHMIAPQLLQQQM